MKTNTSPAHNAAQEATATNIIQLDLGCTIPNRRRPTRRTSRRHQVARSRAAWWFGQMRKAVDTAPDWKPTFCPTGANQR